MMRKAILFLLFSIVSFAQVPQGMSHRGTAYNTSGVILEDTSISIRVRILDVSTSGTIVYEETHNKTTNGTGQYNFNIGQGIPAGSFNFSTINWGTNNKFLEIGIDPTNGTNYTVVGSSQLMSVPYALYSEKSTGLNMATLNTVNELRTTDTHNIENLVYVKGYWYPGDGGGGFFSYKTFDPSVEPVPDDNDGTIFKPANIENGRWVRQYNGNINARFFGVTKEFENTGSPSFSNSDRIQKMIDYASANSLYSLEKGGLTLFFPNGQYIIDKTIILKDKVKLLGEPGTLFTRHDGVYDYMFELSSGIVTDLVMDNFRINLNALDENGVPKPSNTIGGIHIKATPDSNGNGGIWNSVFKNINIVNLNGTGIYLEGGNEASDYKLPNQFLIFENIRVVRHNDTKNSLIINGQQGQLTFLNCTFDGVRNKGVNVSIRKKTTEVDLGSSVISFINCTFQDSEYGVDLSEVENVTLDNCWFENLDIAVQVKNSKGINVLNSHFANAAGFGSISGSLIPVGTGRCIDVENSSVSIEKNYTTVSDPNNSAIQGEKFVVGNGNNNTINLSDNQFQDIRLSETFGVIQTTTISSNTLILADKKNVFINVPPGSLASSNQINRIDSSIGGGETIFVRANGGSIQINSMDLLGLTNKNIFLNGSSSIVLNNGEIAIFKKIDFITGNEKCTYQLVSISKNEDSGWNYITTFFNTVSNYDINSTLRCRNKNGVIYLEGSIKGGSLQTNGLTYQLFRLPEGYRPSRKCSFTIVRAGNTTGTTPTSTVVGRLDIDTNGYVFGVNYSNIWSNLSGISFVVD